MTDRRAASNSVLLELAAKAIESGADAMEVAYKDGYEEVFAFKGQLGYGIVSSEASGTKAVRLRRELYESRRKKRRISLLGADYELKVSVFESFGENAFRVNIRRI